MKYNNIKQKRKGKEKKETSNNDALTSKKKSDHNSQETCYSYCYQ